MLTQLVFGLAVLLLIACLAILLDWRVCRLIGEFLISWSVIRYRLGQTIAAYRSEYRRHRRAAYAQAWALAREQWAIVKDRDTDRAAMARTLKAYAYPDETDSGAGTQTAAPAFDRYAETA